MSDEQEKVEKKRTLRARGTGSIFRPKGSRFWWIGYKSGDKRHVESTKSEKKGDAQALLTSRLGDTQRGIVVTPKIGKKRLKEGLQAVVDNMTMNGRRVDNTKRRIKKHILFEPPKGDTPATGYFMPDRLMTTISTSDLEAYVAHRLEQKAAPASCNHELAIIRRAFRLAVRSKELVGMPHIPMLTLNNARKGFFERHEFDAVLKHMPNYLHPLLIVAFVTGWRLHAEVLPLTAAQVDLKGDVLRLEPGTTKNKEGRSFYLTAELRKVLKGQLVSIAMLKEQGTITPYVFHRPDGSQIKDFRALWRTACDDAGYPGKLFHDFRRSAVRNLERASVPRSTAMAMVGHKTESIYRRYAIVDDAMHREGSALLDTWIGEQKAKVQAERRGELRRFKKRQTA